jgi:arylsulfatase A
METNGQKLTFDQGEYGPELVNGKDCDIIRAHKNQPFCAYYPMMLTQDPYEPTPDVPAYRKDALGPEGSKSRVVHVKHFADMVAYMDKMVGNVVRTLTEMGLRDNSLLIVLGDNGTGTSITSQFHGQSYRGGKGLTNERGMRVPLIISQPGRVKAGVSSDLVDTTDIIPTMLDATGTKRPAWHLDGVSQWPALTGQTSTPRQWIYCWYAPRAQKPVEFVRGHTLKLYREDTVVDVNNDPEEKSPLSITQLTPEQQRELVVLRAGLASFKEARPAWASAAVDAIHANKKKKNSDKDE